MRIRRGPATLLALTLLSGGVTAVEIALVLVVADRVGWWPTALLLLAGVVLGTWLLRREGRRAWRAVREAIRSGRTPAPQAVDGLLVVGGAMLLVLPGFLTDLLGVSLLLPSTRRRWVRLVVRRLSRLLPPGLAHEVFGPLQVKARRGPARRSDPPGPPGGGAIEGQIES